MSKTPTNINEIFLKSHRLGQEAAEDASIRSGVPLVVKRNDKILYIKPKFKYVRVPIDSC